MLIDHKIILEALSDQEESNPKMHLQIWLTPQLRSPKHILKIDK